MVERSVLLKGLQHPFLVGLHFAFQTPSTLYFVLDYVNGGEVCLLRISECPAFRCLVVMCTIHVEVQHELWGVADVLNSSLPFQLFYHLQREGSFPEPKAAFYAAETAAALGYLHSLNIVYRYICFRRL